MKYLLSLVFSLLAGLSTRAQDSIHPRKLFINGYLKEMQIISLDSSFRNLEWSNLIHNRLNLKWKPAEEFSGALEVRSRILYSRAPDFPAASIAQRSGNEFLKLQEVWIQERDLVFASNVERLYGEYRAEKLSIRVGRQRINWGITTTWNPNDIFNSYNFLDFDYEERPGSDGAKLRYSLGNTSNLEIAYARTRSRRGNIGAVKYAFNRWNYDFQLISGFYYNRPTVGAGWSGYIGDAGFKGEFQYFPAGTGSPAHLNLTLETDYKFAGEWYLNLGLLYNNYGSSRPVNSIDVLDLNLSPRNLMPTSWNIILNTNKQFSPRLSINTNLLYAPGTNFLIFFPDFQYNLLTDLDIDLVWQSFFAEVEGNFKPIRHLGFLRARFSF